MIVICTGMSGSGRKSAICAMLECYKPEKVKLINTGERMYEKSREVGYPISEGKILDCSEKDLDYLRARALACP